MKWPTDNLFLRLHKWAWRQDENFLTEAFAFILEYLLEHETEAAVRLLDNATNGFFRLRREEAVLMDVRTQAPHVEGRPDLELRTARQLAFVEVKSEFEVDQDELGRYRTILEQSSLPQTTLILLTRYPANLNPKREVPDVSIRWYQVAEWIEQERNRYAFQAVSDFLVKQFLSFLTERRMIMGQVTWELTGGVRSLLALRVMLYEAANACGFHPLIGAWQDFMGVRLNGWSYRVGIYYDKPEVLRFETWDRKVNKEAAEQFGIGKVYPWKSKPGFGWYREIVLEAEEAHFFARSKANQLQFLETYLEECLELVKRIEIPDKGQASDSSGESKASGDEGSDHHPVEAE